jgi:nucleoside-diphosphate-sugar epimerase
MKILVTGASGFIGSHVVRSFVSNGDEVHILLRENSNTWRINDLMPFLHIFRCDLLDSIAIRNYLQKVQPELCVHMAWYTEPGKYASSVENLRSLQFGIELLYQLTDIGCHKFIGIGTCFEYDFNCNTKYFAETSPTSPWNLYAATKIALSTVLQSMEKATGIRTSWVRLFYQYGPMEDERRLVPSLINSLLNDKPVQITKGEQVRDFLHVEDIAAAILAICQSDFHGEINVGLGQPITVKEIALQIGKLMGKPHLIQLGALPYRPDEPMFVCSDNGLLKNNTSWVPRHNLVSGLSETIKWYETNFK